MDRYPESVERVGQRLGFLEQVCPICLANGRDGRLTFRYSVIQQEPVCENVLLKCMTCRHLAGFGVPITSEQFNQEYYLRGNKTWLTPYFGDGSDPDKIIMERLAALGYIEYGYRRQI